MKKLYLFDFDGTLTTKDTMFLFLRFCNPTKFCLQMLRHLPLFALLALKLAEAETVKKSLISSVIKGETEGKIRKKAQDFFKKYYPKIIRKNALEFIKKIDSENTKCLLVTASLDIWVQPFADQFQMKILSTQAEFKDGIFTGNFAMPNCNGQEKTRRIKEEIGGEKFGKIVAFGDTKGDLPMLRFADERFFRYFQ